MFVHLQRIYTGAAARACKTGCNDCVEVTQIAAYVCLYTCNYMIFKILQNIIQHLNSFIQNTHERCTAKKVHLAKA